MGACDRLALSAVFVRIVAGMVLVARWCDGFSMMLALLSAEQLRLHHDMCSQLGRAWAALRR